MPFTETPGTPRRGIIWTARSWLAMLSASPSSLPPNLTSAWIFTPAQNFTSVTKHSIVKWNKNNKLIRYTAAARSYLPGHICRRCWFRHCAVFHQTLSFNRDPLDLFFGALLLDMFFPGTPQLRGGVHFFFCYKVSFAKHSSGYSNSIDNTFTKWNVFTSSDQIFVRPTKRPAPVPAEKKEKSAE